MTEEMGSFVGYVRPVWGKLHAVARQYVPPGEQASDLVQETLVRAWRSFAADEQTLHHRAWLFVIMRHIAIDWQRSADRRVTLELDCEAHLTELASADLTESLAAFPAMSESAFREFLDDKIVAALDALAPAFREVLILSVAGDLRYREIAEVLDCPIGTVMSRMARARRDLREKLADYAGVPRASKETRS